MAGDDQFGRKVIVFSACHLPCRDELSHDKLLRSAFIVIYFVEPLESTIYSLNCWYAMSLQYLAACYVSDDFYNAGAVAQILTFIKFDFFHSYHLNES